MISFQSPHAEYLRPLALLLGGDPSPFSRDENWSALFGAAHYHGVALLIFHRWRNRAVFREPLAGKLLDELERKYFAAAAREILCLRELRRISERLAMDDVRFAFIKGAATAYSLYEFPFLRSRVDTDLICGFTSQPRLLRALEDLGYREVLTSNSDLLFGQSSYSFMDHGGLEHHLDVHWAISARKVLAKQLPVEAILETAVPLVCVNRFALRPNDIQTLLISCTHAVAHHANDLRLIWLYESARLSKGLSETTWRKFLEETAARQLASPTGEIFDYCESFFPQSIPLWVSRELTQRIGPAEAKEKWRSRRRGFWADLRWDLSHLTVKNKLRLLKEVIFPRRDYMIARWGAQPGRFARLRMPYLYFRRAVAGGLKASISFCRIPGKN